MEKSNKKNEDKDLILIEEELNEEQNLTQYLEDNIYVILRIIDKFPRSKTKKETKILENGIEISGTAYETIAKVISKKFPKHSINSKNLGSMITRTKEKMGIKEPPKTKNKD